MYSIYPQELQWWRVQGGQKNPENAHSSIRGLLCGAPGTIRVSTIVKRTDLLVVWGFCLWIPEKFSNFNFGDLIWPDMTWYDLIWPDMTWYLMNVDEFWWILIMFSEKTWTHDSGCWPSTSLRWLVRPLGRHVPTIGEVFEIAKLVGL